MAKASTNPLSKHFRQPAIYLRLPSEGKFWPKDSLQLPPNDDIPVFPMTVKDEITLKTPDALMNGSGVVSVIESCCPNIKNGWDVPAVDLDAILIAIRLASYGEGMDVTSACTNCKEENEFTVDLRVLLDSIRPAEYNSVSVDGLEFMFKPQSFKGLNEVNMISFEQQKLVDAISNSDLTSEEKAGYIKVAFEKLTDMNIMALVNCIDHITLEDGTLVDNRGHIKEFITNCERKVYDKIKELITAEVSKQKLDPMTLECPNCQHQYTTELNFEYSNFFA